MKYMYVKVQVYCWVSTSFPYGENDIHFPLVFRFSEHLQYLDFQNIYNIFFEIDDSKLFIVNHVTMEVRVELI